MKKSKLENHVRETFESQNSWVTNAANSGRYPGSVLYAVDEALIIAKSTIEEVSGRYEEDVPIAKLVVRLEEAREKYRRDADDEDGYGSSTLAEIIRAIESLEDK